MNKNFKITNHSCFAKACSLQAMSYKYFRVRCKREKHREKEKSKRTF